jgi:hypothetical protein
MEGNERLSLATAADATDSSVVPDPEVGRLATLFGAMREGGRGNDAIGSEACGADDPGRSATVAPGFGQAAGVSISVEGPRNGKRGAAAVMRYGYRRGTNLRRVCASEGIRDAIRLGSGRGRSTLVKPGEPQVRYRLQHAGSRTPEKTVEVVGNHEGGTRAEAGRRGSKGPAMVPGQRTGAVMSVEGHTRRDVREEELPPEVPARSG